MRRFAAIAASVAMAALGACSSSSGNQSATTTSAKGTASCPFAGETGTQTNPGYPAGVAGALTGTVPTASGCIDQVRFNFDGALPPSTVGFTNPSAANQLVMQLGPAVPPNNVPSTVSYSGAATVPVGSLQHVKAINIASASGVLTVTLTLDSPAQFLVSVSQKPQYIVVSVAHGSAAS